MVKFKITMSKGEVCNEEGHATELEYSASDAELKATLKTSKDGYIVTAEGQGEERSVLFFIEGLQAWIQGGTNRASKDEC